MFKQAKKTNPLQYKQPSIVLSKTMKSTQNAPKDMLQFLSRHLNILKQICQSVPNIHPDILMNRLRQSIHLLQKKLSFSLSDNNEQYHDYIQDFYENQLNTLREELNSAKIQMSNKKRQFEQIKLHYEAIIKEKQQHVQSLQTSRILKSNNVQQIQENVKLKKQLDHCRMLLEENSAFIEEQVKAIQSLSNQLKSKEKQQKTMRQKYEQKILLFDQYINKFKQQTELLIKNLTNEQKSYQSQLKQISLAKVRICEQKTNLQRQLETKIEQIQLLTKKILENEIMLGKLERNVVIKEKLVDELYHEIQCVNGNLSKVDKKEEDYQKIFMEKTEEIIKLEGRIKVVNDTNEKLEKKTNQFIKKIQNLQLQNHHLQKQLSQSKLALDKASDSNENTIRKMQMVEKDLNRQIKQKDRYEKQIRLMQQKYQQLFERSKEQKQSIKKQIMIEVSQLVNLVKQKQMNIKVLSNEKDQIKNQLNGEKVKKDQVESKLQKINKVMDQFQRKIEFLQKQNGSLNETKIILENQLTKLNNQLETHIKRQQSYEYAQSLKNKSSQHLQTRHKSEQDKLNSTLNAGEESQTKENEMEKNFNKERKEYKEMINKKEFIIKQLESKVKILEEELKNAQKMFGNEKIKMDNKIKQLEELLKQRYENSSRFSYQSQGTY